MKKLNWALQDALTSAAKEGRLQRCLNLIAKGADPNVGKEGETALMVAAVAGRAEVVRALLVACDASARTDWGATALIMAAEAGQARCVEELLGASDVLAADRGGETALMAACQRGFASCVEALLSTRGLEQAAAQDSRGWRALVHAMGKPECVKVLAPWMSTAHLEQDSRRWARLARPEVLRMLRQELAAREAAQLSAASMEGARLGPRAL